MFLVQRDMQERQAKVIRVAIMVLVLQVLPGVVQVKRAAIQQRGWGAMGVTELPHQSQDHQSREVAAVAAVAVRGAQEAQRKDWVAQEAVATVVVMEPQTQPREPQTRVAAAAAKEYKAERLGRVALAL